MATAKNESGISGMILDEPLEVLLDGKIEGTLRERLGKSEAFESLSFLSFEI